jgi:hypothetical protein
VTVQSLKGTMAPLTASAAATSALRLFRAHRLLGHLRSAWRSTGHGLFEPATHASEPRPLLFFALVQDVQDLEQRPGPRLLERELDGFDGCASFKAVDLPEAFESP